MMKIEIVGMSVNAKYPIKQRELFVIQDRELEILRLAQNLTRRGGSPVAKAMCRSKDSSLFAVGLDIEIVMLI